MTAAVLRVLYGLHQGKAYFRRDHADKVQLVNGASTLEARVAQLIGCLSWHLQPTTETRAGVVWARRVQLDAQVEGLDGSESNSQLGAILLGIEAQRLIKMPAMPSLSFTGSSKPASCSEMRRTPRCCPLSFICREPGMYCVKTVSPAVSSNIDHEDQLLLAPPLRTSVEA